jgi:hypothetical protein
MTEHKHRVSSTTEYYPQLAAAESDTSEEELEVGWSPRPLSLPSALPCTALGETPPVHAVEPARLPPASSGTYRHLLLCVACLGYSVATRGLFSFALCIAIFLLLLAQKPTTSHLPN